MRDQIFDHEYQSGRQAMNEGIDWLVTAFGSVFDALQRIQFTAPWQGRAEETCRTMR